MTEPIFEQLLHHGRQDAAGVRRIWGDLTSHLTNRNAASAAPDERNTAVSQITEDLLTGLHELEGWFSEVKNRVQPVVAEVEKYGDPFVQALSAGLAAAGIVVPVKYVDVALSLVGKLAALDHAEQPAAPAVPEQPAAPVAEPLPAQ